MSAIDEEEEDMVCDLPSESAGTKLTSKNEGNLLKRALTHNLPPTAGRPKRQHMNQDLSPISWQEFFDEKRSVTIKEDTFNVYLKGTNGPIFYLLHGGGYSGLTWACLVKELTRLVECRIVAPDLRGHGDSECSDEHDLSKQTQVRDIADIFDSLFKNEPMVDVCVVGHSMGGALAIHTVAEKMLIANIVGLVVIDVVEGSAMEALGGMIHFLHSRPSSFDSVERAIRWCLGSGTAKNKNAARVSMPAQIRKNADDEFVWRIDLTMTEPYWKGWFEGISSKFLQCAAPKILALAGVDRLDSELTIGQMQGKFQTCLLPKVGHCVQEDSPERLADELARFATRFRFAKATSNFEVPTITKHPGLF